MTFMMNMSQLLVVLITLVLLPAVDEIKIAENIDTQHGRVGSVITEPTTKGALKGYEDYFKMTKGLAKQL